MVDCVICVLSEHKTATLDGERSLLSNDIDAQQLVDQYAGTTGKSLNNTPLGQAGSRERITTDKVIGIYYDEKGNMIGATKNFTIHYAKDGVHIVPARP